LKKIYIYSEEEQESFEHLSDINILVNSKGVLENLSRGQIRTLKRRGLVARRTRGFVKYTDKGLRLLKELKLI
jgi:Mn-dependent DtxR family transcriptional regulator